MSGIVPFLFITLLCLAAVEGGYLALEYFLMKGVVAEKGAGDSQSPVRKVARSEAPEQKHDYMVILERNLFGSSPGSSKIEVAPNEPSEDLVETSLEIVLKGTINGDKGSKRAIIYDKNEKTEDLYQVGDGIQGAFVKKILRGKVILTYNGRDEVIEMSETAGSAEPPSPVAVAPGTVQKRVLPRGSPAVQRKPARRIVKPRVIKPPQPEAES
jgi:general secretion pathway protein C